MTPDLETISQALLPGASRWKRAEHIAGIVKRKRRIVLYWFKGQSPIPHWAEEKLLIEYSRAMREANQKL